MRITLLLRSLHRGGAEQQVLLLANGLASMGHDVCIASFYPEGDLLEKARKGKAAYLSLDKKGRWDWLGPGRRLRRHLRTQKPHILYSFLTEPNLAAALCRPHKSATRLVWGLRTSNMDPMLNSAFVKFTFALAARFSPRADAIVFNSGAGLEYHKSRGYRSPGMTVIPNGFDTGISALTREKEKPSGKSGMWGQRKP